MNKAISYVIVSHDYSVPFNAQDDQLDLLDVFTLQDCINLAAMGIEIYLQ